MKEIIITSSVLILCIMLIRQVFQGKISSRLQYALWILVALRLMIPASAQIYMTLGSIEEFRIMDLTRILESKVGDVTEQLEKPVAFTMSLDSDLAGRAAQFMLGEELASGDGPTSVFLAGRIGLVWLDVLRGIWIGGMVIVALWMFITNLIFTRKLHRGRKEFIWPELEQDGLLQDKASLDTKDVKGNKAMRRIKIYTMEGISSPCLYGVPFREAVYLTPDIAEDQNMLRHVLTHEMCHKKHGDSFWAILRSVLLILYWMNPLVWVAAVLSKRDCELACDEEALLMLGEGERISYGETLLSIITCKGKLSDIACTATTMTGSGKSVKERIKYIAEKPRVLGAAVVAVLILVIAVSVLVFTKNPLFHGNTWEGETTLTAGDLQVRLPETIAGISGFDTDRDDNIVIYHVASGKEVGRFSVVSYEEAVALAGAGREVVPTGDYGQNPYLKEYLNNFYGFHYNVPVERVQHNYTPNSSDENQATESPMPGDNADGYGMLDHYDYYYDYYEETDESDGPSAEGVPGTDSNDDRTFIINPEYRIDTPIKGRNYDWLSDTDWEVMPLDEEDFTPEEEAHNYGVERMYSGEIPNSDVTITYHDDTTYIIDDGAPSTSTPREESADYPPEEIIAAEEIIVTEDNDNIEEPTQHTYTPYNAAEGEGVPGTDSNDDKAYIIDPEPSERTTLIAPEESQDYLPNEQIETVTIPAGTMYCYVYVKGDYSGVKEQYLDEMDYINNELKAVTDEVIVLSINQELREEMFETLAKNRAEYLGEASKIDILVKTLPVPAGLVHTETTTHTIQTDPEPSLNLTVRYQMVTDDIMDVDVDMILFDAVMLFATIKNVNECSFIYDLYDPNSGNGIVAYHRADLEEIFGPLWSDEVAGSQEDYTSWLDSLYTRVIEYLN